MTFKQIIEQAIRFGYEKGWKEGRTAAINEAKDATPEVWKEVPGFEHYFVSNMGRVFNSQTGRFVGAQGSTGYTFVNLSFNGFQKTHTVHSLVAEAFCDKPWCPAEDKLEVDHINRDRTDNRAENLRWVTHSENMKNRDFSENGGAHRKKAVYNLDTGERFESSMEAARCIARWSDKDVDVNMIATHIREACRFHIRKVHGADWAFEYDLTDEQIEELEEKYTNYRDEWIDDDEQDRWLDPEDYGTTGWF